MSAVIHLVCFGLRQAVGAGADEAVNYLARHFTDRAAALPRAVAHANERAWQALAVALGGDGFLDRLGRMFVSSDDKGVREQVRRFLADTDAAITGAGEAFRRDCLDELKRARKAGTLSAEALPGESVAKRAADLRRYDDPTGLAEGAHQAVYRVADDLHPAYPSLAKLLRQPTPAGTPLLAAAFAYFFRREVETDDELANGLLFDGLRQLSASQAKSFAELNKGLAGLGDRFDELLDQLDRMEASVNEAKETATATHGAVLDLQAEFERVSRGHAAGQEELLKLMREVLARQARAGMPAGEVRPEYSFSIRSEDEKLAVRQLLDHYRGLPPEQRRQVPALLNGLGKLQLGAGDPAGASRTFAEVAESAPDSAARAEAHFNAYRAALERRAWDEALAEVRRAAELDRKRFAPFPVMRYRPQRILGAGGFGTVFLCHDAYFKNREVAVKALHVSDLARSVEDVFGEAHVLAELQHPSVIGVLDCNYADADEQARPYIVMPYFPGVSLEAYLREHGPLPVEDVRQIGLQIASGVKAAHDRGVLHRDLKPDNVLVRKSPPAASGGASWEVKVIDFGLATRRPAVETTAARRASEETVIGSSVAGTRKYAPPEQMGELPGVKPGPYSDVYSFGKLCCFALFGTTEPRTRQLNTVPAELRELLEKCIEQELQYRLADFGPVIETLEALDPVGKTEPQSQPQGPKGTAAEPTWMPALTELADRVFRKWPGQDAPPSNEGERPRIPPLPKTRTKWSGGVLSCPGCKKQVRVPEELAGQLVKCPMCETNFNSPAFEGDSPTLAPPEEESPSGEEECFNTDCPHCKGVVAIPNQYAGQLMQCPICKKNFTAPEREETPSDFEIELDDEPSPPPAGESFNVLCPHCQKMLTIPGQYAGQLMKCPLCAKTFTAPEHPQPPKPKPSGPAVVACPSCKQRLRVASESLGKKVKCPSCSHAFTAKTE